jgi:putative AlgH/UPF0301 family transcriptional regulator
MTTDIPRATPAWLIHIEHPELLEARRRRERWAKALKALGVVALLLAIAT